MKLEKLWESYDFYTQSLTEQSRKLAFAAAAICWFFKGDDVTFPALITWALLCIVVFFLLDILQYLSTALLVRGWAFKKEVELEQTKGEALPEDEVSNPPRLYRPGFFFFCAKLAVLMLSFLFLISEFLSRLL